MTKGTGILPTLIGAAGKALGFVSLSTHKTNEEVFNVLNNTSRYDAFQRELTQILHKEGFKKDEIISFFSQSSFQIHHSSAPLNSVSSTQNQGLKLFLQLSVTLFSQIYGPIGTKDGHKKKMSDFTFGVQNKSLKKDMLDVFFRGEPLKQLDENFSSNYFLSVIPQIMQHFLFEGLFSEVLKYHDFFDAQLVEATEKAIQLYRNSVSKASLDLPVMYIGLEVFSKIASFFPHKHIQALEKSIFIFIHVYAFLQKKISYYTSRGIQEIIFSEDEILHINGLLTLGYRQLKAVPISEYTEIGYFIGNMAIFGAVLNTEESEKFYKHPLLPKILKQSCEKSKKTLLCKMLFYIDETYEELFAYFLTCDDVKLTSIEKFFRAKSFMYIDIRYLLLVFQNDLETLGIFQKKYGDVLNFIFSCPELHSFLSLLSREVLDFVLLYNIANDRDSLVFLLSGKTHIAIAQENMRQREYFCDSLAYSGLNANTTDMYCQRVLSVNIFQPHRDCQSDIGGIFQEESFEGTLEQTIEKNRQRMFRRSTSLLELLPNLYGALICCSISYRSRIMWEIFDTKNSDEEVYLFAQILVHFGKDEEVYKLQGKFKILLQNFFEAGFSQRDINTENLQLVFAFLGDKNLYQVQEIEKLPGKRDVIDLYPTSLSDDIRLDFLTHFAHLSDQDHILIIQTLSLLNGYQMIFLSWLMKRKDNISTGFLQNVFQVFYFFGSLGKRAIYNFENIEKIFDFLLPLEVGECQRRISVLYETFGDTQRQILGTYDDFKDMVIRYIKNGNESIIDDYLYPDEEGDVSSSKEKRLGGGRLLPISEREFLRKIGQLGFVQVRSSGGHLQFKSADGKHHLTIPHSSHRDTVDKGNIKQILSLLGLKIGDWNNI